MQTPLLRKAHEWELERRWLQTAHAHASGCLLPGGRLRYCIVTLAAHALFCAVYLAARPRLGHLWVV